MQNFLFQLRTFVIFFTILLSNDVFAQDFSAVDAKIDAYPKTFSHFDKFAAQINSDFTSDAHKARAAFTWIAKNIQYDLNLYRSNAQPGSFTFRSQEERIQKERQFDIDLALKTLRTKKGVCHGYTVLFNEVMKLCGVESVLIPGTSKSNPLHIGQQPQIADHAWNAIKLDGKWQLIDATWGAGAIDGRSGRFVFKFNAAYFLTAPDAFFLNHFPQDRKWLLIDKTAGEFANLPLFYGDYLKGGFRILTPSEGILSNKNASIQFRVSNLQSKNVTYAWSTDMVLKPVKLVQAGNISSFDVVVPKNTKGFLTIFVDNMSVASYKIAGDAS